MLEEERYKRFFKEQKIIYKKEYLAFKLDEEVYCTEVKFIMEVIDYIPVVNIPVKTQHIPTMKIEREIIGKKPLPINTLNPIESDVTTKQQTAVTILSIAFLTNLHLFKR